MTTNYQHRHDVTDLALSTIYYREIYEKLIKPRIEALRINPQIEIDSDFWMTVARAGRREYCREWGRSQTYRFESPELMAEVAQRIARQYEGEIRATQAAAA